MAGPDELTKSAKPTEQLEVSKINPISYLLRDPYGIAACLIRISETARRGSGPIPLEMLRIPVTMDSARKT